MIKISHNGLQKDISAVLFDMDGVITDSMPWHFQCWKDILEENGVTLSKEEAYKREGEQGIVTIINLFKEKGKLISEEDALEVLKQKEILFNRTAEVKIFDGVIDFIKRLSENGVLTGLVTGTSWDEMIKLLPDNLINRFETIVTGDRVTKGKPDPEPYTTASEKIGVPKEETIVIENAPLGIKSSKAAGLFTVAIQTSLGEEYLTQADIITKNHNDLFSLFLLNN